MAEFPTFKARELDSDLGSGHTAYRRPTCITHRHLGLPTYQISLKSKKPFLDGRTGGRTFEVDSEEST